MVKLTLLVTLWLATVVSCAHLKAQVSLVAQFPVGTWLENLAVRRNGHVLTTSLTKPHLYEVHPGGKVAPKLVAAIPGYLALSGITEVEPDVFYVAANNFSIETLSSQPNASAIYRLDLSRHRSPVVPELVASFDNSILLNGLTTFSCERKLILVGDAGKGWVWHVNVATGKKHITAQDPRMAIIDAEKEPIGVNGIKLAGQWMYFSNTNQELLARLPLANDASASGPSQLVIHYEAPDDILLIGSKNRVALVAGNNDIRFIDNGVIKTVSTSALLQGSTAIQAGNGPDAYFVSTNGGIAQYGAHNVTVPGKLVRIDITDQI